MLLTLKRLLLDGYSFVGSMEAPSKAFLLFFLLPEVELFQKLNGMWFSDIFRAIFVSP